MYRLRDYPVGKPQRFVCELRNPFQPEYKISALPLKFREIAAIPPRPARAYLSLQNGSLILCSISCSLVRQ
jgi:hypothetical protein